MPIASDEQDWHTAPLLYLSADNAVTLDDAQRGKLKSFIESGGTLLCSPATGSGAFVQSVRGLAAELFPQHPLRPAQPEHPVFNIQFRVDNAQGQSVFTVHNGVRDLLVLVERDWGYVFQSTRDPGRSPPHQVVSNLFTLVTGRGAALPDRLGSPSRAAVPQKVERIVTVARVVYNGNHDPEPAGWRRLAEHLRQHAGVGVRTEAVPLEQLGRCEHRLAHLAGVDAVELTAEQLLAIDTYTRAGGTLLVETVGGNGAFAASLEPVLADHFRAEFTEQPLVKHPVITGHGLAGGTDASRVTYRRQSVLRRDPGHGAALRCVTMHGRPVVLLSTFDLTAALAGLPHADIHGYSADSARDLVSNLVLATGHSPR